MSRWQPGCRFTHLCLPARPAGLACLPPPLAASTTPSGFSSRTPPGPQSPRPLLSVCQPPSSLQPRCPPFLQLLGSPCPRLPLPLLPPALASNLIFYSQRCVWRPFCLPPLQLNSQ
ncbi:programmed cell death protein 7-like [Micropterus dolomieu]|uniref:programmed cell death protein 7-like n=1 Tax=Micropterus dolomieu TaxID=147949 RepID=UPI001E8E1E34|nr:programmed cell death protein 7-like [Micropterus dolomieu]